MPHTDEFIQGFQYNDFIVTRSRPIPELQCRLIELTHQPSQASVIHIQANDQENFFCLSFQTLPFSSNGIAHALEHLVLCGSEKFPVKDPFFSMSRRSLHTFMNALTGSDFTCYPAASQIEQDFYNLLDIYLDAVFHPLLHPLSFSQEAHRYELTDSQDNPLSINGVVYNEMKGAIANPFRRIFKEITHTLFPNSPYGFDSGGDPKEIPSLTLQQLKSFHDSHYHPSKCLFFFYGDFPLQKHLDFIVQKELSFISTTSPLPPIKKERPLPQPIHKTIEYPLSQSDSSEDMSYISFSWLTTSIENQLECLALLVLEIVLLETDASFLKESMLQSKLCKQVIGSCDTEIAQVPFIIIATGCAPHNSEKLALLLFSSLKELASTGLSQEHIENALHQLEFAKSEIHGDNGPFGLSLYSRTALLAHHGLDPLYGLEIHSLFTELRNTLSQDNHFFQRLISKYFIENPHFVQIVMNPSTSMEETEKASEQHSLQKIYSQMSDPEKQKTTTLSKQLQTFQQEDQSLSCLPSLHIADVPKSCRNIHLNKESIDKINLFTHETCTNDIIYLDIAMPLPKIAQEDLWLLTLFSFLLPQLGCGTKNYQQVLIDTQAYTGGIYSGLDLNRQTSHAEQISPSFHIKGRALGRNKHHLCSLLSDFLLSCRFDEKERIKELLEKHLIDIENSITYHALDYAIIRSASQLSIPHSISELWNGISYLRLLRNLVHNYSKLESNFIDKMLSLKNTVLLNDGIDIITCTDAKTLLELKENQYWGLTELPTKGFHPWESPPRPALFTSNQGFTISSNVSFSAATVQLTSGYSHPDSPHLTILSHLINNLSLHQMIREQGGAYGGGSGANPTAGTCTFYSYKDPNLFSSLQAFEKCFDSVSSAKPSDLEEAKLGVFQDLDSPIPPGERAQAAYSWRRQGKSEQIRQSFRNSIINATQENIQTLIPKYFPKGWAKNRFVALSGNDIFDKEKELFANNNIEISLENL